MCVCLCVCDVNLPNKGTLRDVIEVTLGTTRINRDRMKERIMERRKRIENKLQKRLIFKRVNVRD